MSSSNFRACEHGEMQCYKKAFLPISDAAIFILEVH